MPINLTLIPFDLAGKVYRAPMPFGPYDNGVSTLNEMREARVQRVFTLVEEFEWAKHSSISLPLAYEKAEIRMIHFPITDFEAPKEREPYLAAVRQALDLVKNGENIAVHCMAASSCSQRPRKRKTDRFYAKTVRGIAITFYCPRFLARNDHI